MPWHQILVELHLLIVFRSLACSDLEHEEGMPIMLPSLKKEAYCISQHLEITSLQSPTNIANTRSTSSLPDSKFTLCHKVDGFISALGMNTKHGFLGSFSDDEQE